MKSSRRNFLAAGLAMPAAGLAVPTSAGRITFEPAPAEPPKDALHYRTIGRTGMKVTTVSMGCMITSDPSVIEKAADLGILYFDTARGYQSGNNERMVGAALKSRRDKLFISTKSGARDKAGALEHIDTSLKELGTDHVDIWYLHGKSRPEDITDDLMEAQNVAKKAGKVRFAGVSTHNVAAIADKVIASKHFDAVLFTYNFTMDKTVEEAIDKLKAAGIGTVGMKVMAGGFRTVKEGNKLYPIFKKEGALVAALKWVLRNPKVDTTIPSMTDMDQLDDNFKAMSAAFTPDDDKLLTAYLNRISPIYCRMCNRCEGTCPKGLPVADMLRILTYADGYGQFSLARTRFLELPEHVAAVRCGDCSECSVHCPNGVRVSERLARAQELFV